MTSDALKVWLSLPEANRKNIFGAVAETMNLPPAAIEKDWWVVRSLQLVFQTEIAAHTVFKGGTSLSKAWNVIDRFSEDIDLALDRTFLGFEKEMTKSQVSKLRKKSFEYISEKFLPLLQQEFHKNGFADVALQLNDVHSHDEDPVKIEVRYPSITEEVGYLPPRVLIEIGSRSLREPFTDRPFRSFVGRHFNGRDFADGDITIPTVNPERTFLEKVFLLHEEFQQPEGKIRTERKSRHLYDLEKLMDTEYGKKALEDKELYRHLVEHRKSVTFIRGIDYDNHAPEKINPIPPDAVLPEWKKDYGEMLQSMIYGESLPFDKLMERIHEIKRRINNIHHG